MEDKVKYILCFIVAALIGWVLIDVDHIFNKIYFHIQYVQYLLLGLACGLLFYKFVYGGKD